MKTDIFKLLNKEQEAAVRHTTGPSVILAGAGSGKTRVLIHKVRYLIEENDVDPLSIAMITFTNKAAKEMKERIRRESGPDTMLGYVGTFHSFACRILRREAHALGYEHTFAIYDTDDQLNLLKDAIKKAHVRKTTPSYYLHQISTAKNQLISPEKYISVFSDYYASAVAEVYSLYQKALRRNNAMDFDDLIGNAITLFMKHPQILRKYQEMYRYLLVDEFQDTNYAQYVLTRLLARKYQNITVVGDFAQSIYSWRGADIRNLETFQEDFSDAKVFELSRNYRSTQSILDYAYDVISLNQLHPVLKLYTKQAPGEEVTVYEAENEEDEARYIVRTIEEISAQAPLTDCAILYRTNAQSRAIEEVLIRYAVPYTLYGGVRFYERREIKDVLSYLRLLINPEDELAVARILKLGKRNFAAFKKEFPKLRENVTERPALEVLEDVLKAAQYMKRYDPEDPEDYNRIENIKELLSVAAGISNIVVFLEQVALVESEYFNGEKRKADAEGVRLMTLHQAKGLEFPYVFVAGLEEGLLPHSRSLDDRFQLEEERRLFYVGLTRAMKRLYITHAKRRFMYGRRGYAMKSRFIGGSDDPVSTWSEW